LDEYYNPGRSKADLLKAKHQEQARQKKKKQRKSKLKLEPDTINQPLFPSELVRTRVERREAREDVHKEHKVQRKKVRREQVKEKEKHAKLELVFDSLRKR
jgi:hypothetical protein